ncbi:MAG: hypothetical protein HC860_12440 [Alkalinema sp. RU_4_3]|nr:hypothetical protein [Alkalinema sp. RU_4_3]
MNNTLQLRKIGGFSGVTIALLCLTTTAQATQFIQTADKLGSNDSLSWDSLGKVFNPAIPGPPAFLPFSIDATSKQGLGVNVSLPPKPGSTPPFVFRNALPPNGIPANFALNDFVLFTGLQLGAPVPTPGNPGPLTLRFAKPVFGVGAQFSVDDTPSFTAFIDAYDRHDKLIGHFSRPGFASTQPDNSAIFLGVRSRRPNIAKVVFRSSAANQAIGIGTLRLVTKPKYRH